MHLIRFFNLRCLSNDGNSIHILIQLIYFIDGLVRSWLHDFKNFQMASIEHFFESVNIRPVCMLTRMLEIGDGVIEASAFCVTCRLRRILTRHYDLWQI